MSLSGSNVANLDEPETQPLTQYNNAINNQPSLCREKENNRPQSLALAVENLKQCIKSAIPPPQTNQDVNLANIDYTFFQPVRGIKHRTQVYKEKNAIVSRIKEVTMGKVLDAELRNY